MNHKHLIGVMICLASGNATAQLSANELRALENRLPENRTVLGGGNDLLSAGAEAIRHGRYEDGIRLTLMGLDRPGNSDYIRAAALSNLCAAHAGKNEPDEAIRYCAESIGINEHNWRAWSNRSYAYWLKGMYEEASVDLEAAMSINPDARQIFQIRGMLNEAGLRPNVIMEDHQ